MELILNTFGTSLSRDNEAFMIVHKDGKQRVPAQGVKSIQISKGAQITSDAVLLAIENEIEVLFMDKTGNPIGRIWSPLYGKLPAKNGMYACATFHFFGRPAFGQIQHHT